MLFRSRIHVPASRVFGNVVESGPCLQSWGTSLTAPRPRPRPHLPRPLGYQVLQPRTYTLTLTRNLHTSTPRRDFHFDTHHFVQRLEREGLNRAQAEGIMTAIAEVIDESVRNMTSGMVTKSDQEKVRRVLSVSCSPISYFLFHIHYIPSSINTLKRLTLRSSSLSCS